MSKNVTEDVLKKALDEQTKLIIKGINQKIDDALENFYLKIKCDLAQIKDDVIFAMAN